MFNFLRDKLRNFFKKSPKETIEETEKKEKGAEIAGGPKKEAGKEKKEDIKRGVESRETKQEEPKEGFFARIKKGFVSKIDEQIFQKIWNELETLLLQGNVALEVVEKIKSELKAELIGREIKKENIEQVIREELRKAILSLMIEPFDLIEKIKAAKKPYVIIFFGINGSGKTTTIAKLANLLKKENLSCVIAASDTFRAASIEQLEKHAGKIGIKLIRHDYGADAAAVAFDAVSYAKAHGIDAVLVDTAGRMHTQGNLMREMEKICRVTKPDLKIFVGESIVGNDMIEQAKSFLESAGMDAIILSKADVDEKGGTAISASYITKKPVLFLGTGQGYENIEIFSRERILKDIGL